MSSLNALNFNDNIFVKKIYSNFQPVVQVTKMLPHNQQDTGNRQDR